MNRLYSLLISTVLFIVFFAYDARAQTIKIVDGSSGAPLGLVNIISYNPELLSITDSNGNAEISTFKGLDSIQISRLGFLRVWYSYDQLTGFISQPLVLDSLSFPLDTFIISTTGWRQNLRDVPNKITSISPQQIALSNTQTAADVLQSSGEVFVQKSQLGGGSPMIRGFSANRVLLTIDGVRMNNAIFRGGNVQNVISIDPQALDRVEVSYGPGSVKYGSDALGGVLSYYTKNPIIDTTDSHTISGSALARTSTANQERTGHIDFNYGGKKWAARSSVTFSAYDDLLMGSNGPKDYLRNEFVVAREVGDTILTTNNSRKQIYSGYEQINLMQKILFKPSEKIEFTYGAHFSKTSNIPRYDRLILYEGDSLAFSEWYYGPQEWMMHNLSALVRGDSSMFDEMRITVAYQQFKESRHNRLLLASERVNQYEQVYATSINMDLQKRLSKVHQINYGIEGVGNWINSTAEIYNLGTEALSPSQSRYPDGSTWFSSSIYAGLLSRFSREWSTQVGVRANYIAARGRVDTAFLPLENPELKVDNTAINGSAGVAYKPTATWQINMNISTGFRAPNIDDLAKVFDSEPGAVVIPNADLKPEYAYNADLGVTKVIDDILKIDITGFYTILQNAMVRRNTSLNGADSVIYLGQLSRVQSIQNVSQAVVYGIQAGYELKIGDHWTSVLRYNYQFGEGEEADGSFSTLRHVAPAFGVFRIGYGAGRLKVDAYAEMNGEISFSNLAPSERNKPHLYALNQNGDPYSPSWYTLNLKAQYRITKDLTISGGVENILDVRYRPYSSGIAGAGRNFQLSLKAKF